ncbi:hypothetical protein HID58_022791 [Brassica napus]|uniref:GRF-type domain-containing protein n=1 Tax=Brassica napus TaxID=3708 RepID=A0ABQ8D0K5_BRANA|nr:hypothetical protein HID58_022791 [Brassica napus]
MYGLTNRKLDEDDEQSSILFNFFLKKLDSHLSFFDCHMMSSGCEDSSVNTMGIRGIPEQCGCGRRTGIYTSKTKENPGRTFFRCPTFRNATNEVKKLNVIMKVGFLVASVSCIVFFMRKRQ